MPWNNEQMVIKKEIDTVDLRKLNELLNQEEEMEKKTKQMLAHPIETTKITVGKVPNLYKKEQNIDDNQRDYKTQVL